MLSRDVGPLRQGALNPGDALFERQGCHREMIRRSARRGHVAAKSGFVNLHLLVSPEDRDHLAGSSASASARNDRCDCTREELSGVDKFHIPR